MKKIFTLVVMLTVVTPAAVRAQDAATEERINKLNGTIADLRESQEALKKLVERLAKEIEGLRDRNKCPQLTEIRARKERIQEARRLIHESSLQGL